MKFVISLLALFALNAHATIYDKTADQVGGTLSVGGDSLSFSPFPADLILWSDDAVADFNPQSAAHIQSVIEAETGFTLSLVADEAFDGGSSYSTDEVANFYAIHYNGFELVMGYADAPLGGFDIAGLGHDFSNMRAFNCVNCPDLRTNEVPVPAAAWLFGTGLMGIAGIARKRRLS